ncbi:unnamed protein product [Penicillium salamii]|uniref:Helicase ATP-binding domain-containing protein n=1 Tax=Penicillium salamii TaxID=1612424 RepID=A0A9W4J647_9EURO|nr:unnamed protein product [Penicillium salamii]
MASQGDTSQQVIKLQFSDNLKPTEANANIPELRRGRRVKRGRYLAQDLPPLHVLEDIFADMVSNAMRLGFNDVLLQLGNRSLRVATVCSGTEAPLLAVEMIQKCIDRLQFTHAFSCEIVPLKQSYIERSFRPPVLFRDLTELGKDQAKTAYGALTDIPGDLDILFAGTACVDFSLLNSHKKALHEGGESGATFDGLLQYVDRYRPRMVIQENVRAAPWGDVEVKWNEIGYMAVLTSVDTKHFYIPQTRERGYMIVIDKRRLGAAGLLNNPMDQTGLKSVAEKVRGLVSSFKRPASSPVGVFLLSDDDRRLEVAEKKACLEVRSEAAWEQYQIRHQHHRDKLDLGDERPISRSAPGSSDLTVPDFYWRRFWETQPERVWETADINFLVKLAQSYDMNFKERWIDLSQGVDRGNDSLVGTGIAGCLTPKGLPFVTTRGGPVSGSEALSLQGLPLDRMLITRETQAELMDMAGNAMTSTVVCAVMFAGLIAVHQIFGTDEKGSTHPGNKEAKPLLTPNEVHSPVTSILPFAEAKFVDHDVLKAHAARTVLRCYCERQTRVQDEIFECVRCGHSACKKCQGNPPHSYTPLTLLREDPSEFLAKTTGLLPMKLALTGLNTLSFEVFHRKFSSVALQPLWADFTTCVSLVLEDAYWFSEIKRGRKWRVIYTGKNGHLHLEIGPDSIEWFLFGDAPKCALAKSAIREMFAKPVARMTPPSGSLINGPWEVYSPLSTPFSVKFSGKGDQLPSFESKCGLAGTKFAESKVWDKLLIKASQIGSKLKPATDHDISGTYNFLELCGTACGAMYKKEADGPNPAMFLFLDPAKTGLPENDVCVFSLEHSRLPGYEVRMTIAELDLNFRAPNMTEKPQTFTAFWRECAKEPAAQLVICDTQSIAHEVPKPGTQFSIEDMNCQEACITLTSLSAPPEALNLPGTADHWQSWDPEVSSRELKGFAWLFSQIAGFSAFKNWSDIISIPTHEHESSNQNCNSCNPPPPGIIWGRDEKGKVTPYENQLDAAVYERAMKSRPSPFQIFRRINANGEAELRVTLNIQALTHQARGKLAGTTNGEISTSQWRLIPQAFDPMKGRATRFTLMNNAADVPFLQPPNFKKELRREQLRSLSWMISQEAEGIEPFMEEEIEEAVLSLIPWRAEVKLTMPNTVRGGVIADEVGYGKTAIVLGLIDSQYQTDLEIAREDDGLIPTKATLIVVPGNVLTQWDSEIEKFLGTKYKVLVVNLINDITIQEVQDADIVLVSWSILANDSYYSRLQRFTGTPQAPSKSGSTGRSFDNWFHEARASLRELVGILKSEGPQSMLRDLRARRRRVQETQADATYVPSARLRGQAFADAHATHDPISEVEELSDVDDSETQQKRKRSVTSKTDEDPKRRKTETEGSGQASESKKEPKQKAPPDDNKEFGIATNKKQDWRTVRAAFFHAFSFTRLVIDEYTYAGEERQASLLGLTARSKWILSGTPLLNEFADIKSIARYLGLHLGVDDDGDCDKLTHNPRLRNIRKNFMAVEAFQMYQPPHSNAWYGNRRSHAQNFLNRFARSNMAEITRIPVKYHEEIVTLTPTEKEVYDELFQTVKMNKKQMDDLTSPLNTILSNSHSQEEALILGCAITQIGKGPWNLETCQKALQTTTKKQNAYWDRIKALCREAAMLWYRQSTDPDGWKDFHAGVMNSNYGDRMFVEKFEELLMDCFKSYKTWTVSNVKDYEELRGKLDKRETNIPKPSESSKPPKRSKSTSSAATASDDDHTTAMLKKAIIADTISLLKNVHLVDRAKRLYQSVVDARTLSVWACANCTRKVPHKKDVFILKSCGHILCTWCTSAGEVHSSCEITACNGHLLQSKLMNVANIEKDEPTTEGSKLIRLREVINRVPENEFVLIFVQIGHLMPVVSESLTTAGIEHRMVTPASLKVIGEFIEGTKPAAAGNATSPRPIKALLLNLGGAAAAGLNLQCANHVIFFSPFLAETEDDWNAGMSQAVGRARRYGQPHVVHIYHLLARNTVEVNIFQQRQKCKLVWRHGAVARLLEGEIVAESDTLLSGESLRE